MVTEEIIILERGPSGLGFNIKGGNDCQIFDDDTGIYVSKIKPDGAAGKDGRLQEGDKIISVNDISIENVTHEFAVRTFVNAGSLVKVVILPGEEQRQQTKQSASNSSGGSFSVGGFIIAAVGVAAVAAWYLKR